MTGDSEKLTLQVKDFGPIAEGKVDLRPLTVFIGPSNTGKSYLATLIYVLHRFFSSGDSSLSDRGYPIQYHPLLYRTQDSTISGEQETSLLRWAIKAYEEIEARSPNEIKMPLPSNIAEMVRPWISPHKGWIDYFKIELTRNYGVESLDLLIRYPGNNSAAAFLRRHVDRELPFEYRFNIDGAQPSIAASIPDTTQLLLDIPPALSIFRHRTFFTKFINSFIDNLTNEHKHEVDYLLKGLAESVFPYVTGSMSRPARYLPAARTGVMHAHHVVMSAMMERATVAGSRPSPQLPTLNGVLADFLTTLMAMGQPRRLRAPGKEIAKSLEKNVLRGSINLKESPVPNMYPTFVYRPDGWDRDLPLMNTASMISELAPLVLYLRYVVQPGETLIIEEPEAHLHPAMQAALMRELVKAVHAGIRVIITTHSEWMLEKLANLTLKSELPNRQGKSDYISPTDVGAWLFKPNEDCSGSVVQEIKFDPETGFTPEQHSDLVEALYNEWAGIFSAIEDNKAQ